MLTYPVPLGRRDSASRLEHDPMLTVYRIAYGTVALPLANLLNTRYYGDVAYSLSWLMLACKLSVAGLIVAAVMFWRLRPVVLWGIILVWEALFTWYGWFSPGAPFELYRPHAATAMVFGALFLWFLSLGVLRSVRAAFAPPKTTGTIHSHR